MAGVVAALAVTTPFTAPANADVETIRCPKAPTVTGAGVWQRFPKPNFESLVGVDVDLLNIKQEVSAMAVHPGESKVVAVTNGNSVYVSRNGGCDWDLSLRLDAINTTDPTLPSGETTLIRGLQITGRGAFLAIAEDLGTDYSVGRLHVLRSTTGAYGSWQNASSGLPPLGEPLVMRGHRTNLDVQYLSISGARDETCAVKHPVSGECVSGGQEGRELGLLYRSTDGGATWQSRTDPGDLNGVSKIKYFSVDDDDPAGNRVWVVANGQLRLSTNGGNTFSLPEGLDQDGFEFTAVESLANNGDSRQLELVAFSNNSQMIRKHKTRGWIRSLLPFQSIDTVAQRPGGDIAVTTTPTAGSVIVWRIYPQDFQDFEDKINVGGKILRPTLGWEEVTPPVSIQVSAQVRAGDAPGAPDGTFYIKDPASVFRFLRSRQDRRPPGAPPFTIKPPPFPKGKISPDFFEVDLDLGKRKTVPYTLTLPPAPTPIDLYLLVDNSGSMQPVIDDLKANLGSIANSLQGANVDLAIGVGQINVQPDRQSVPIDDPRTKDIDESKPRPIYQRLYPISTDSDKLTEALNKLDGNGGSGQEPQLEALYQSVRGTGLELIGFTGPLLGYNIPKYHDAGFRKELNPFKIIVHATDEKFSTDIRGENAHNKREDVAKELVSAGVLQIGLSQGMPEAHKDLVWMAKATGAVAPEQGADCDGDGRIGINDVKPRQALVCGTSDGLDRTLVNLIQAIDDPATITLHPNNAATMVKVSRVSFDIDAKQQTKVSFSVTYSCENLEEGRYVNEINASLRGYKIAGTSAHIDCGGVSDPPPPQPPRAPVEPLGNPPPPQPQPVPAPIPVNPVPQPQPQTQVQTQVNPQAGMADQEEEQFQLAAAENDLKQEEDQLAMTGMSYEDSPAVVLGLGMTMAAGAGLAVGLRRRSRTASAKVTVRR
ncbi:MAG TPA: hypothetical protein VNQ77_08200 [Frankiaceae bacterium]|nr:hypothetical protein [Frankiaceae bacterium]